MPIGKALLSVAAISTFGAYAGYEHLQESGALSATSTVDTSEPASATITVPPHVDTVQVVAPSTAPVTVPQQVVQQPVVKKTTPITPTRHVRRETDDDEDNETVERKTAPTKTQPAAVRPAQVSTQPSQTTPTPVQTQPVQTLPQEPVQIQTGGPVNGVSGATTRP